MGEVAVTLQVMPVGKEVDMGKLKEEVESRVEPRSIEKEPVAFGLESLKVMKVIPDDAGGTDDLEEKILEINDVKDVKVTDQRKLL